MRCYCSERRLLDALRLILRHRYQRDLRSADPPVFCEDIGFYLVGARVAAIAITSINSVLCAELKYLAILVSQLVARIRNDV